MIHVPTTTTTILSLLLLLLLLLTLTPTPTTSSSPPCAAAPSPLRNTSFAQLLTIDLPFTTGIGLAPGELPYSYHSVIPLLSTQGSLELLIVLQPITQVPLPDGAEGHVVVVRHTLRQQDLMDWAAAADPVDFLLANLVDVEADGVVYGENRQLRVDAPTGIVAGLDHERVVGASSLTGGMAVSLSTTETQFLTASIGLGDMDGDEVLNLLVHAVDSTGQVGALRWIDPASFSNATAFTVDSGEPVLSYAADEESLLSFRLHDCDRDGVADVFLLMNRSDSSGRAVQTLELARSSTGFARSVLLSGHISRVDVDPLLAGRHIIVYGEPKPTTPGRIEFNVTHLSASGNTCGYFVAGSVTFGSGHFELEPDRASALQPTVSLSDVDRDGVLDLVQSAPASDLGGIQVHRGRSCGGYFALETLIAAACSTHAPTTVLGAPAVVGICERGITLFGGQRVDLPAQPSGGGLLESIDFPVAKHEFGRFKSSGELELFVSSGPHALTDNPATADWAIVSNVTSFPQVEPASYSISTFASGPALVPPPSPTLPSTTRYLEPSLFLSAIGDVNGDDLDDVLFLHDDTGGPGPFVVRTRLSQGDGTFALAPGASPINFVPNLEPVALLVRWDLVGDASVDLLVATNNQLAVFAGNGTGLFASEPSFQFSTTTAAVEKELHPGTITVGDVIPGDERAEIILFLVTHPEPLVILQRDGSGDSYSNHSFALPGYTPDTTARFYQHIVPADMSGDGVLDLIVACGVSSASVCVFCSADADHKSYVLHNSGGSGMHWEPQVVAELTDGVAVADWNADGIADLVSFNKFALRKPGQLAFSEVPGAQLPAAPGIPIDKPMQAVTAAPGRTTVVGFSALEFSFGGVGRGLSIFHISSAPPRVITVDPTTGSDFRCRRWQDVPCRSLTGASAPELRHASASLVVVRLLPGTHTGQLLLGWTPYRNLIVVVEKGVRVECSASPCISIVGSDQASFRSKSSSFVRFVGAPLHLSAPGVGLHLSHLSRVYLLPLAPQALGLPVNSADAQFPTMPERAGLAADAVLLAIESFGTGVLLDRISQSCLRGVHVSYVRESAGIVATGLDALSMAHFTVDNCSVQAMVIDDSTFELSYYRAVNNTVAAATVNGGAGLVVATSVCSLRHVHFERNTLTNPTQGGAGLLIAHGSSTSLQDATFAGNTILGESGCGAGMAVFDESCGASPLAVLRARFVGNEAASAKGGGFCIQLAAADLEDCSFAQNTAQRGGAIVSGGLAKLDLRGGDIYNNTAREGAAVLQESGRLYISACNVSSNVAQRSGGAVSTSVATLVVENSTLHNNVAGLEGGAIACVGTGSAEGSAIDVARSDFSSNHAGTRGGAIASQTCAVSLHDSHVHGNSAGTDGGAVSMVSLNELKVLRVDSQTTFTSNTALAGNGGCVFLDSSQDGAIEHTIEQSESPPMFTECLARSGGGGALFIRDGTATAGLFGPGSPLVHSSCDAAYGNAVATQAVQLVVAQDEVTSVPQATRTTLRGGPLEIALEDRFGQRTASQSALVQLVSDATPLGKAQLALSGGSARFDGRVALEAAPGVSHSFHFSTFVEGVTLDSRALNVFLEQCAPGSFVDDGTRCTLCKVGEFAAGFNAPECTLCPPGTYGDEVGMSACIPCENGTASPLRGSSACTTCPPGSAARSDGALCEPCSVGKFSSQSGSTECTSCNPGSLSRSVGSVECVPCPPGSYHFLGEGVQRCELCDVGRYQDQEGQTQCLPCEPGSSSNRTGAQFCPPCSAGSVQPLAGATICRSCPPSTIAGQIGLRECSPCESPTFALGFGNRRCSSCSSGEYTRVINGTFLGCEDCPGGVVCPASGRPVARSGFWLDVDRRTGEVSAYECAFDAACAGASCAAGRKPATENPLCSECEEGLYEWGGDCIECDSVNVAVLLALVLAVFTLVLALHRFTSHSRNGELPVTMYFVQQILLFAGTKHSFMSALAVFNFDVVNSAGDTCVAPLDPEPKLLFELFAPLVAYGLWVVLVLLGLLLDRVHPSYIFRRRDFMRSLIALFVFLFNSTSTKLFAFLNCVPVTVGGIEHHVVQSHPAVGCESSFYKGLYPVVILGIIFTVALVPLGLLVGLVLHRRRFGTGLIVIDEAKHSATFTSTSADSPDAHPLLNVLSRYYRPQLYFWQVFSLFRRTVLVAFIVAYATDRPTAFMAATMCNVFFLLAHVLVQPFARDIDNRVETGTLLLLTLLTSVLQVSDPDDWIVLTLGFVPSVLLLAWIIKSKFLWLIGWVEEKRAPNVAPPSSSSSQHIQPRPSIIDQPGAVIEMHTPGNDGGAARRRGESSLVLLELEDEA